jgi:hypothetical protein
LAKNEKGQCKSSKEFLFFWEKKGPKTPYFKGEKKNLKMPHLYIKFQQHAAKTLAGMLKLLKFPL